MRALAALALLALSGLAGCTTTDDSRAPPDVVRAVADTKPLPWSEGSWWSFDATFRQNRTYAATLVVHRADENGFHLGSNASGGFFGLPFSGNLTRDLNPVVAGQEWPMFRFPLADGKSWSYEMFGHQATATAYAAVVHAPGLAPHPGFRLEAASFGQVFARYDYSPATGWFTRLEIVDPESRAQVLGARLTGFGANFGRPYYVEEVIAALRVDHPGTTPPGKLEVRVPDGFSRVQATLTAQAGAGAADARLRDGAGRELAHVQALAQGLVSQRVSARVDGATTWTLDQLGAGKGSVYLEVTGLRAAHGHLPPGVGGGTSTFALGGQSTRPALPQAGQTTSTGWPVGT
ncbi:MAG TPA: hypothetical protein VHH36_03095 [Candidatus Thermoplasmatota archaeon]|nr:hypothetical protein [Candidatus Thermoplasmatota archaeon]